MSQTINSITANGLFSASEVELATLTENEFSVNLSDCKDPITVIIDATSDKSKAYTLVCVGADGMKDKEVKLATGVMNAIRITTHGYKNNDGSANFKIDGGSSAGLKVAFLKYAPVVNN